MKLERYEALTPPGESGAGSVTADEASRKLVGYAVVWGAVSSVRADGKRHRFDRGSITFAPNVLALYNHNTSALLGDTVSGTVRVSEDDVGVRVEIDVPNTTTGADVFELVRTNRLRGMSFGASIPVDGFKPTTDPGIVAVSGAVAYEVTVTPIPAMQETAVAVATETAQKQIAANVKEQALRASKLQLDRIKLATFKPGRVSGGMTGR